MGWFLLSTFLLSALKHLVQLASFTQTFFFYVLRRAFYLTFTHSHTLMDAPEVSMLPKDI